MPEHNQELHDMIQRITTFGDTFLTGMDNKYLHAHEITQRFTDMKWDIFHAYQEGDYADAFAMTEEYTEKLEEVEIAYTQREKEQIHKDVDEDMQWFLEMVHTAPEEITLEQKKELDHLEDFFWWFDTHDDHMMSWLVYRSLQWIELVIILVLIEIFSAMLLGIFPIDEKHLLLMTFIAILGVSIYLLRKTRYKWWLLFVILCFVGVYYYVVPRLT